MHRTEPVFFPLQIFIRARKQRTFIKRRDEKVQEIVVFRNDCPTKNSDITSALAKRNDTHLPAPVFTYTQPGQKEDRKSLIIVSALYLQKYFSVECKNIEEFQPDDPMLEFVVEALTKNVQRAAENSTQQTKDFFTRCTDFENFVKPKPPIQQPQTPRVAQSQPGLFGGIFAIWSAPNVQGFAEDKMRIPYLLNP